MLERLQPSAPPIETHISLVFVGTDTVWKLKKAVKLPFLDFTSGRGSPPLPPFANWS